MSNAATNVITTAGSAEAEDGVVILDGPNGVAMSLAPHAARATGERLVAASLVADEQNLQRPKILK